MTGRNHTASNRSNQHPRLFDSWTITFTENDHKKWPDWLKLDRWKAMEKVITQTWPPLASWEHQESRQKTRRKRVFVPGTKWRCTRHWRWWKVYYEQVLFPPIYNPKTSIGLVGMPVFEKSNGCRDGCSRQEQRLGIGTSLTPKLLIAVGIRTPFKRETRQDGEVEKSSADWY